MRPARVDDLDVLVHANLRLADETEGVHLDRETVTAGISDILIVTGQLQNMSVVFLPGDGGVEGSFFVNHRVPEEQVPDVIGPTSGRYEDSILQDLIPAIERDVLRGRVRR